MVPASFVATPLVTPSWLLSGPPLPQGILETSMDQVAWKSPVNKKKAQLMEEGKNYYLGFRPFGG